MQHPAQPSHRVGIAGGAVVVDAVQLGTPQVPGDDLAGERSGGVGRWVTVTTIPGSENSSRVV